MAAHETTTTRVAPDGTVTVPVGAQYAGREVVVIVSPAERPHTRDERTRGTVDDAMFVGPQQGAIDARDGL